MIEHNQMSRQQTFKLFYGKLSTVDVIMKIITIMFINALYFNVI